MNACGICGHAVYQTPSGWLCERCGGGVPVVDKPVDETFETAQRAGHLAQLRAHVEAGGGLDPVNARWLLEQADGGMWGRAAARAADDALRHRAALRSIVRALLTGESARWGRREWAPIVDLLSEQRRTDPPPALDLRTLDVPFRFVEAGEDRE